LSFAETRLKESRLNVDGENVTESCVLNPDLRYCFKDDLDVVDVNGEIPVWVIFIISLLLLCLVGCCFDQRMLLLRLLRMLTTVLFAKMFNVRFLN